MFSMNSYHSDGKGVERRIREKAGKRSEYIISKKEEHGCCSFFFSTD
jgi:hypothetical protein